MKRLFIILLIQNQVFLLRKTGTDQEKKVTKSIIIPKPLKGSFN